MRSSADWPGSRSGGVLIGERRYCALVFQAESGIGWFSLVDPVEDAFYIGLLPERSKATIRAARMNTGDLKQVVQLIP